MPQPDRDHDRDTAPAHPRPPQDFARVLTELRPEHWPPRPSDLQDIAAICARVIAELDTGETKTADTPVIDVHHGEVTTAQARRILGRTVSVADDGVAVTLVPAADESIYVEMRARVEDARHLRDPELVLAWQDDEQEHLHHVALKPKGPQWYMLS